MRRRTAFAAATLPLLAACASPLFDVNGSETALPLSRAWFDGRKVDYITTDASDATMAAMMGINHAPRLADALAAPGRRSTVERVYKFAAGEQISVFQSAPAPLGAAQPDPAYSPLWRLVMVHKQRTAPRRELRSEEEVLAAAERGEVWLEVTDIVVNCPITRPADGVALKGVR
jgi:hypothetical protein